ncbi:MAG TPA: hypothetical protein VFS43_26405 [Polyangiaceae bacterium]|nr:hypothetical protein [Polyangiaceae bacterium]
MATPARPPKPTAIYYEHPDWFRPLFAEFERRGLPVVHVDAARHRYDPSERAVPYGLVVNRASPSAYLRGRPQTTFHTLAWLRHLARLGVPVVNGAEAYAFEISKAAQLDLFEELGVPYPASRVINHGAEAPAAAAGLRFPVLVKANVGGSGAGIARYDAPAALAEAARAGAIDLGVDGTALVQEAAPLRGGGIVRVELLDGRPLYAIRVYPEAGSFNLCPADACETAGGAPLERAACPADAPKNGLRVEAYEAPPDVVEACARIVRRARIDVGGVEYLVDDRDGRPYFYDVNALSNFVADAPRVVGFDPFARLVDYLEARARAGA